MADIILTETQAKAALRQTLVGETFSQHRNLNNHPCAICNKRKNGGFAIGSISGGWVCSPCQTKGSVDKVVKNLVSASESSSKINKAKEAKKLTKIEAIAEPYIEAGLGEPFAHAIAKDPAVTDSVMDLWEADWWKQYDVDDILIVSVLKGVLKEDDAKWLNTVRSDHEDLVLACIDGTCTTDWARALLGSGFLGDSDGVSAALSGAEPKTIARIRRKIIDVDLKLVPPCLTNPKKIKEVKKEKKLQPLDIQGMNKQKLLNYCMTRKLSYSGSANIVRSRLKTVKQKLQRYAPLPKPASPRGPPAKQLKSIAKDVGVKGYTTGFTLPGLRTHLNEIGEELGVDMDG